MSAPTVTTLRAPRCGNRSPEIDGRHWICTKPEGHKGTRCAACDLDGFALAAWWTSDGTPAPSLMSPAEVR